MLIFNEMMIMSAVY